MNKLYYRELMIKNQKNFKDGLKVIDTRKRDIVQTMIYQKLNSKII